ncbi:MAG TPA: hypothetical protein VMV92_42085 [Streptosporangiaceae bacterium]|nr:hypothetical protein [Streptosporangiaceae bacterium]
MVLAATVLLWISATVLLRSLDSTVASVRGTASPAFLNAIEARAALSDADRAAWQSFRSGEAQLTGPGQLYQNDITTAGQDLERLAALAPPGGAGSQQLQTVSGQLVNYQALVEQADAAYRTDIALGSASSHDLGYAYLTYASNSMRDPQGGLLASINQLAALDKQALDQQLGSPWTDSALFLALVAVGLLGLASIIAAQVFLQRRFRRVTSPPLLLAAALVCVLLAWVGTVTLPADAAFNAAQATALPKLTGIWQAQTRAVDAEAATLRANAAGQAPGAGSGGLSVIATQPASSALDADLLSAEDSGGLAVGIPVLVALIAGLAYLGVRPRLDEYRG